MAAVLPPVPPSAPPTVAAAAASTSVLASASAVDVGDSAPLASVMDAASDEDAGSDAMSSIVAPALEPHRPPPQDLIDLTDRRRLQTLTPDEWRAVRRRFPSYEGAPRPTSIPSTWVRSFRPATADWAINKRWPVTQERLDTIATVVGELTLRAESVEQHQGLCSVYRMLRSLQSSISEDQFAAVKFVFGVKDVHDTPVEEAEFLEMLRAERERRDATRRMEPSRRRRGISGASVTPATAAAWQPRADAPATRTSSSPPGFRGGPRGRGRRGGGQQRS